MQLTEWNSTSTTSQGDQIYCLFYLQGDNIISSTHSSSVLLSYKSIIYKSLKKPLSFRAIYKPNPIFITHLVSLHKHILRTYCLHWNHNTFSYSFKLIICDTNWLYHRNQRPNFRFQGICKVNHWIPRRKHCQ